jgi:hypothetical protein
LGSRNMDSVDTWLSCCCSVVWRATRGAGKDLVQDAANDPGSLQSSQSSRCTVPGPSKQIDDS